MKPSLPEVVVPGQYSESFLLQGAELRTSPLAAVLTTGLIIDKCLVQPHCNNTPHISVSLTVGDCDNKHPVVFNNDTHTHTHRVGSTLAERHYAQQNVHGGDAS